MPGSIVNPRSSEVCLSLQRRNGCLGCWKSLLYSTPVCLTTSSDDEHGWQHSDCIQNHRVFDINLIPLIIHLSLFLPSLLCCLKVLPYSYSSYYFLFLFFRLYLMFDVWIHSCVDFEGKINKFLFQYGCYNLWADKHCSPSSLEISSKQLNSCWLIHGAWLLYNLGFLSFSCRFSRLLSHTLAQDRKSVV